MKTKIILRLIKAGIFFLAVNSYGVLIIFHKPILSSISFAIAFSMFLIELYRGDKK